MLLSFALLLSLAPLRPGQTPATQRPVEEADAPARKGDGGAQKKADDIADTDDIADAATRREAMLAELRALEAESKELLKPLDAASAKAEMKRARP
jgi:hypothetical protein